MAFFAITVLLSFSYSSLAIADDLKEMLYNEFKTGVNEFWPSPDHYNFKVIRRQSIKVLKNLIDCGTKMGYNGHYCNHDIMDEVLRNKSASRKCCGSIVKAGKQCQISYMKLFSQFYQFKGFSSKAMAKTDEIWKKCSVQMGGIAPFSGYKNRN
ncbi:PREDICTED: uncharacterized protein LOC104715956 [Camelina sativa]|uniref:Uncharacterized protein LOC104715956 n=1 Tax=Camelina sativa TaxID=90675 RepID=A0ABM0TUF6_CAMSA|nr:PREDICTED: uncharacterized protein LOC104715956 [Camelina sativa]